MQHQLAVQWGLQRGATYDSSPVEDSDRLPDLPADRQVRASLGLIYARSKEDLRLAFGSSAIKASTSPGPAVAFLPASAIRTACSCNL